jgi:hypothetical protein
VPQLDRRIRIKGWGAKQSDYISCHLPSTRPSNHDSSRDIIDIRYDEYTPLLEATKALNERAYTIADHLS